jgi:hypothetical protein
MSYNVRTMAEGAAQAFFWRESGLRMARGLRQLGRT